jgi:hypothetical protein
VGAYVIAFLDHAKPAQRIWVLKAHSRRFSFHFFQRDAGHLHLIDYQRQVKQWSLFLWIFAQKLSDRFTVLK